MKNLIILFIFLIAAMQSAGQKIKFTDTGNVWLYNFSNKDLDIIRYNCYYLDTIVRIDTIEYRFLTNKVVYSNSGSINIQTLVREDTAGRIYVRSLSGNDSSERLLFDYNIKIGDTMTALTSRDTFRHYLSNIDTVLVGNTPHRIYNMTPTSFSNSSPYKFIEGVGCTSGPFFPFFPLNPESSTNLFCFTVNGVRPKFSKKIDFLDNANSCHVSISEQKIVNSQVEIYPQPATKAVHIILPAALREGTVNLYNLQGQLVYINPIKKQEVLTIHNPGNWQGLYYYYISGANGNNSLGKLLFE